MKSSEKSFVLRDAASTVVMRENSGELEVLLLKRSDELSFGPGFWVFPGGKVEAFDEEASNAQYDKFKLAAVREAKEETGLDVDLEQLQYFFRITTPTGPIRFNTTFFLATVEDASNLKVDGSEIVDAIWLKPSSILQRFKVGGMPLMVPTVFILMRLSFHKTITDAVAVLTQPPHFDLKPKALRIEGQPLAMLYPGDDCYDQLDQLSPDQQHRVQYSPRKGYWRYIHSADATLFPRLDGGYGLKG